MNDKIFCFQCHNSVYRIVGVTQTAPFPPGTLCLYCYKFRRYKDKDAEIGDCKYVAPESAKKLLNGTWKPNVSSASKPR